MAYRTIEDRIWDDPRVKSLPANGKLLFVYLITNRHAHVSGIYYLPRVLVELETGIPSKALDTLYDTLSDSGLARIDPELDLVWVRKMLKYQGRGAKNAAAASKHLITLHKSFLISEFCDTYPEVKRPPVDTLSDTVCHKLSGVGYQEQEQKQDQKQEQLKQPPYPPPTLSDTVSDRLSEAAPRNGHASGHESEITWRVGKVWEAHLRARSKFFVDANGCAPTNTPTLTLDLRKAISHAIRTHDAELMAAEMREEFLRNSRTLAAGVGIFYDPFLTGRSPENDSTQGGKRYLEPDRAWVIQRGKPDPVNRFAELAFERRALRQAAREEASGGIPVVS